MGRFDDVTVKSIKTLHVSCLGYNRGDSITVQYKQIVVLINIIHLIPSFK